MLKPLTSTCIYSGVDLKELKRFRRIYKVDPKKLSENLVKDKSELQSYKK